MSFSAMTVTCQQCGKKFRAYPDRKGSRGKYPKFCGRECYNSSRAPAAKQMQIAAAESRIKPFRVSSDWVWYAHGPAADGRQPSAVALCELASEKDYALVADRSLVQEIVSVAGLYAGTYGGDAEDRATARRAAKVIERANAWLASVE